jgi:syringomycin synthetase protein SyrE
MVHLAVLDVLIGLLTGAADIPVGVPIANRHWLDSEGLIMSLVNTLVLRTDLAGATTFRDVVQRVRRTALDAFAHQDMPFEQLVRDLAPKRDLGRSPLFQVFLNVQNAPLAMPRIDDVDLTVRQIERRAAQHDLSLSIDTSLTNTITLEYATDLFDDDRMQRLLDEYVDLLATAVGADAGLDAALPDMPRLDQAASAGARPDRPARPATAGAGRGHHRVADDGARTGAQDAEAPRPGLERQLAAIWESALGVSGLRRHDDFFELGGHSLLAVRMLADVEAETGVRPPVSALFGTPDLASFADAVANEGWTSRWTSMVEVQPGGSRRPYFYVSPFLITALSMHELADRIGRDVPFYALQPQGIETDDPVHQRVEDMATHYITEMRSVQPTGPYLIGGHCGGAWVAFEMALQLQRAGERVGALIVVDVEPPGIEPPPTRWLRLMWSRLTLYARTGQIIHSLRWQARLRVEHLRTRYHRGSGDRMELVRTFHRDAHRRYGGGVFDGDLTFVRSEDWANLYDKRWHREWATLATGHMTEIVVCGAHSELLTGKGVRELATATRQVLDAAE